MTNLKRDACVEFNNAVGKFSRSEVHTLYVYTLICDIMIFSNNYFKGTFKFYSI